MQYPYGSYVGQATPDARLMCDIPHGRGTFCYHDGGVYDGFWNRGNWEGQVVFACDTTKKACDSPRNT